MLMEYLVEATMAERNADLQRFRLQQVALDGMPRSSWLGGLWPARGMRQSSESFARSARSTSGHSLSMME
jgi:hypothetical protein